LANQAFKPPFPFFFPLELKIYKNESFAQMNDPIKVERN